LSNKEEQLGNNRADMIASQYNLSVESNQNVESKRQSVESKMGK